MKIFPSVLISAVFTTIFSVGASAACPTNIKLGDTWCERGMMWKCEKCASQECPIFTGQRCLKEDDAIDASATSLEKSLASGRNFKVGGLVFTDGKPLQHPTGR